MICFKKFVILLIFCACSKTGLCAFVETYQWQFINFTWQSEEDYETAIETETYIPVNNAIAGVKIYEDNIYLALPRLRLGIPATLSYISITSSPQLNPLLTPFPNWEINQGDNCSNLRNVPSMEIDPEGIMWVLDIARVPASTITCPPKLLLLDLKNDGEILQTFIFPEEIASAEFGLLVDLVVDDSDGGYAYITDASNVDPGLVVYSKEQNRAWKIRDSTMFAQQDASGFVVNNITYSILTNIDGIALSPKTEIGSRTVYFCAVTALNLYSISTEILKNEMVCRGGDWRREVVFVGQKQSQSDGIAIDELGDLYYGLLPLYGVGKWNINQPFSTAEIVEEYRETIVWPDSFGFDGKGNIFLLADNINQFIDPTYPVVITEGPKFSLLKLYIGTRSYLH